MKKQKLSVIKALRRTVPIIFMAKPLVCIFFIIASIAAGVISGLAAPANERLFVALANLATGDGLLRYVYIGAMLVTGVMLIRIILDAVHSLMFRYHFETVNGILLVENYNKIMRLPAQIFEDSKTLDAINMADHGKNGAISLFETIIDMIFRRVTFFIVIGIYLWSVQPMLLLAIFSIFVAVGFAQIFEVGLWGRLEKESAPLRRLSGHYNDCMTSRERMKETRLLGTFGFFKHLYINVLVLLTQKQWNAQKRAALIRFAINMVNVAGCVFILAMLFYYLRRGDISVGSFAAVFAALNNMFNMVEQFVRQIQYRITQHIGSIHNYIDFLDIPIPEGDTTPPDFSLGITAKDVCFTYPKGEKPAVDGVSLNIKPGETIALVGENGSGKTTLVKLLCGLYSPTGGQVLLGGQDVSTTKGSVLYNETSAVFQDFRRYALNLGENVRVGRIDDIKDPASVLKDADIDPFDTATFPHGLETVMNREFDGIDLSGGQWQRVAMARGLFRRHDFIILDEPTAAIDPLEETRVYKRFAELTKDKIAVLVTHRLGSARIADKIIVMDAGKIVETGTHEQLLNNSGKYAEMWTAQAEAYSI